MDIISIAAARKSASGDVTRAYVDEQDAKKTDKVTGATAGNLASLDASGNLADSGSKAADFIISGSATGTAITLTDSADGMVQGLTIYGRSEVVEGEIKSVGDDGLTVTTANSDNTLTTSSEFTTALPLCSVSDEIYDTLDNDKVTKMCAEVDLGDIDFSYDETYHFFQAHFNSDVKHVRSYQIIDALCAIYKVVSVNQVPNNNKTLGIYYETTNNINYIRLRDDDYSDAATFKTAVTGVKLIYPLATPTTTPLTAAEISAFRQLRTFDSTTNINITDEPEYMLDYLKNTDNGEAISRVVDLLQGADIKAFTYTGTGTVNHSTTFPEVPKMVLAIYGEHTFGSNTWSVSTRPFVWGLRGVYSEWCAVGGTTNGNQMMPATYNGREISFSGMAVSDPGASLNASGVVYTVLYLA